MTTLLNIVDLILVVAIALHVIRTVWNGVAQSPGSMILTICVAVAAAIFAMVSFSSAYGMTGLGSISLLLFLALFAVAAILIGSSWNTRAAS